ncbi:MAG: pilus assembly protein TadG-related protein [Acidimicrobiia bacterium]
MRMTFRRRAGRDRERGAVLAMTAILTTTCIACAAFAIDAGAGWGAKRRLRTSTDAGALAAAKSYAEGFDGCAGDDDTYVTANDSAAVVTDCQDHSFSATDSGYVTVAAERTIDFTFAGIFGINDADVTSTTHAMYGYPTGAIGLRPMGLCINAHPALTAWLNLPTGPTGDSGTIRIPYNKDHPDACGSTAPGNWGMLDLNGGSNSNAETKEWVANGYPGNVKLSPPDIEGDTGAFSNSIDGELSGLLNQEFTLPVFDLVYGNGSNAKFRLAAFVWVQLIDFKTTGSQGSRYLELQFLSREVIQGTCCGTVGLDTGVRGVRICGVDPDEPLTACLVDPPPGGGDDDD